MYEKMTFGPYRQTMSELDEILKNSAALTTIPTDFGSYEAIIWDADGNAAHVESETCAGDESRGSLTPITEERAQQLLVADHRTAMSY